LVVSLVANGLTSTEIIQEYPDLELEDIQAVLQYVAFLANEKIHPVMNEVAT
jgi:uncharacterized protein (DUF433 family)